MHRNFQEQQVYPASQASSRASTIFLAKVFNWMAIGLGITAAIAFLVSGSAAAQQLIFGNKMVFYGLIIGELGLVIYLSTRIKNMTAGRATTMFLLYSALNGATLSAILLIYTATSVAGAFIVAAGMFASMAVYGTVTKKDLSSMGSFMFMGLIGMIIASVVTACITRAPDLCLLVIDDGSTDDTGTIAQAAIDTAVAPATDDIQRQVVRHDTNRGKGEAIATALHHAMGAGHSHLITIDGDGQHIPADIARLRAPGWRFPCGTETSFQRCCRSSL